MIASADFSETLPATSEFGTVEPVQRFVLDHVTWEQYEAISDSLRDRPALRLTYDRGRLEFMSKSPEHGRIGWLLGMLVSVLIEECDLVAGGYGEITLKKQLAEKGLEPDQCFYSANFLAIRDKHRFDMSIDPPPDLAIEVDVTNSSINRMSIYAGLRVPEVWRWSGDVIHVYQLGLNGEYEESDESTAFLPGFPVNELLPFLNIGRTQRDSAMTRAFRIWLRQWITDRGLTS